jgi:large subunit ribosomal protein L21
LNPGFPAARRSQSNGKRGVYGEAKTRSERKMKYAIIESGGKQYRAVEGETIEVDRLPVPAGAEVALSDVLLLADGENVTVGTPLVKDMNVFARVAEHFKGPKVVIFNYSPKKRIRVKTGHRQNYTRLQVEQIGAVKIAKVEAPVEVTQPVVDEEPLVVFEPPAKEKKTAETKAAKPAKAPAAKKPAKPAASKKPDEKKPAAPKKPAEKKPAKTTKPAPASKTKKAEK